MNVLLIKCCIENGEMIKAIGDTGRSMDQKKIREEKNTARKESPCKKKKEKKETGNSTLGVQSTEAQPVSQKRH